MNVLVTGGAGFIGSHVVEKLLAQGYSVRVLDNLSTGKRANLPENEHLTFVEGNVDNSQVVDRCTQAIDAIVHLAAIASVQASIAEPVATHQTNLIGTLNVLESARRQGVKRIIYASSAAVYGDVTELPISELSTPQPMSPYAVDKLSGEFYLTFYNQLYGMESISLRFFNIYGPRQNPSSPYSGVISIFVDRALAKAPVNIFGDGLQTRDFVYVADLAEVVVRSLTVPAKATAPLNVGTGRESSLVDLLEVLERQLDRQIERRFAAARAGDIYRSRADNRQLQQFLGDMAWTPLDVGLAELLAFQQ